MVGFYNEIKRMMAGPLDGEITLSRGAPSTTRPPLRAALSKGFPAFGKDQCCRSMQDEAERRMNLRGDVGEKRGSDVPQAFCSQKSWAGENDMPYIYRWDRQGRKGQPCKVTARSKRRKGFHNFNSVCVEFADGYTMVTSGNAIRKASPPPPGDAP